MYAKIKKEQSNHNTIVYRGSATRTSLVLALRPRPEYPTREFQALSTNSFSVEKPFTRRLHFIRYKARYRVLVQGRTILTSPNSFYRHKARCRVLYQGYNHSRQFFYKGTTTPDTLSILRPKILTDHLTHNIYEVQTTKAYT